MIAIVYLGFTVVATALLFGVDIAIHPTTFVQFTQLGPGIAALVVNRGFRLPSMLASALRFNSAVALRSCTALISATSIFIVCLLLYRLTGRDIQYTSPNSFEIPFIFIFAAMTIGSCGEELGWRCFLQPLLEQRYSMFVSAVTVGLVWGSWHLHIFREGPNFVAAFFVGAISMSVIMAVLVTQLFGGSLVVSAIFHTLVNVGLVVLMPEEEGDTFAQWTFAVAAMLVAIATYTAGQCIRASPRRRGDCS